jgi:hypothetical protein
LVSETLKGNEDEVVNTARMIKIPYYVLLASSVLTPVASTLYTPTRMLFDDLVNIKSGEIKNDDTFWNTLHDVGMISITNIPNFNKKEMFKELEDCVHKKRIDVPKFELDDGTRRLTVATRTASGRAEDIFVAMPDAMTDASDVCSGFRRQSDQFREAVELVSGAFASRLSSYTGNEPVLLGSSGEEYDIKRVITHGDHLEHFHSYYTNTATSSNSIATIDWHIDQGLVLMFTPGEQDGKTTNGFFIQLGDGSAVEVDFDSSVDDLVIMLGDGIDQYLNPTLTENEHETLRAVPHALTLPETGDSGLPRTWYGRMVLPPSQALYPSSLTSGGNSYTFGEMRSAMINEDPNVLDIGCASESMVARELHVGNPNKCDPEYTIHCWMRCMEFNNTKSSNVTRDMCEEQGMEALCVDDDNHLWINGLHDSSYYIQCAVADDLEQATLRPTQSPTMSPAPTMTRSPTTSPAPTMTMTAMPTLAQASDADDSSGHMIMLMTSAPILNLLIGLVIMAGIMQCN